MSKFAMDPFILSEFKKTALSRSCLPSMDSLELVAMTILDVIFIVIVKKTVQSSKRIIKLHSSNVDEYRSDQLYKLIPEIVNPG